MAIIDQKLDVILLNKSDMPYHTVAQQLQKNSKDMYIETTNRSTSQLIANRDRKIEELTNSEEYFLRRVVATTLLFIIN